MRLMNDTTHELINGVISALLELTPWLGRLTSKHMFDCMIPDGRSIYIQGNLRVHGQELSILLGERLGEISDKGLSWDLSPGMSPEG